MSNLSTNPAMQHAMISLIFNFGSNLLWSSKNNSNEDTTLAEDESLAPAHPSSNGDTALVEDDSIAPAPSSLNGDTALVEE